MALRRVSLDLPGAPAEIVPADLNGDGRVDLLVAVARTTWGEIGNDRIQGMVQITEVVPALFDRREAYAFLQSSDGSYHSAGAPLALPDSVLSLEAGPPGLPVVALTDVGLSVIRVAGESGAAALALAPVLVDRPVLAGSRSLVPRLGMVQDVDGDGTRDVILPALDGLALYRGTGRGLSERAASRVRLPGDERRSGAAPFRRYPLPRIADLDGDHLPDMLVLDTRSGESVVSVVRGTGEGRFRDALRVETRSLLWPPASSARGAEARPEAARMGKGLLDQPEREMAFFGDLDGDGQSEAVFTSEIDTGKSDLKKAREPEYLYRFHHVRKDLVIDPNPYQELKALGHGFRLGLGDARTSEFQDLDGDGRKDLVTVTLDFSLFQVLRVLATKRIGIGLDFHVWSQGPDGRFAPVRGLDLSETLRMDLNDLKLERLAQFAGDFDGDGRADFVHLGRGKNVTIHRGRPGCSYAAKPDLTIPLEEEPLDVGLVRVGDLDGDGRADLGITRPLAPDDEGVSNPVRLDLYLSGGGR
jgi:hypothetical protein